MFNHRAIIALYPNAFSIDDTEGVFDKTGKKIEIDEDAVAAWVDPEEYKYHRRKAYPSVEEQLDTLFHGGYDAWRETIEEVKNKYPKP